MCMFILVFLPILTFSFSYPFAAFLLGATTVKLSSSSSILDSNRILIIIANRIGNHYYQQHEILCLLFKHYLSDKLRTMSCDA